MGGTFACAENGTKIKESKSKTFTTQVNTGVTKEAVRDALTNGYINVDRSKTGEVVTIKSEVFNDLDNSVGSPDGKKALVGLSNYGIDINQKDYKLYVNDDDSLFASDNPGAAGTLTLDGSLKDANNLNSVVIIHCSANETGNTFTVTGTNSSGTSITEQITGVTATNTAVGSKKFTTITSITTSATASGNIKIGITGGAALSPVIQTWFEDIGIPIIEGYGLTETSPVIVCERFGPTEKTQGGLRAIDNVKVVITNPGTTEIISEFNEQGEICCIGPNIMKGYHNNKVATDESIITINGERAWRICHFCN